MLRIFGNTSKTLITTKSTLNTHLVAKITTTAAVKGQDGKLSSSEGIILQIC